MNFSYACKKCGFTVISNDKARIITDAQGFKRGIPKCILVKVGDSGTVARPGLAHILEARRGYNGR